MDTSEVKIEMSPENDIDNWDTRGGLYPSYGSGSSDDVAYRKIQKWDKNSEVFLQNIVTDIENKIQFHRYNSRKYKILHYTFGFFSTALPLVSSGFVDLFDEDKMFETKLLITIGLVNTVSQFFRLETLHNKHLEYEDRFEELKTKINIELTKPKSNRTSCEIFLLKITDKYNLLNYTGPE